MYFSILAVILLLAANAFFVAAEFALVKVRPTQIEVESGDQGNQQYRDRADERRASGLRCQRAHLPTYAPSRAAV